MPAPPAPTITASNLRVAIAIYALQRIWMDQPA
jgi:hypothetical protein